MIHHAEVACKVTARMHITASPPASGIDSLCIHCFASISWN